MTENTQTETLESESLARIEKKVATKKNSFLDFVSEADPEALQRFMPTEPVRRSAPKIGRNEPCVCGSGKKYKKCCG